ncbi:MAG: type II secretion system major pseudopilin GspG [Phycisphaerales bacterium]
MSCKPARMKLCIANPHRVKGFSLIEILAVLVLIGIAAGLVAVNVRPLMSKGKQNAARSDISTIVSALEAYYMAVGEYPSNDQGLEALRQQNEHFDEPLLTKGLTDPWGRPYQYNQPGSRDQPYEVFSFGADGRDGGEGADVDIRSDDEPESK